MIRIRALMVMVCLNAAWGTSQVRGDVVTLGASQDATIYSEQGGNTLANGGGEHIFAGRTAQNVTRRALLRFDIGAVVPEGATINSVSLRLNMSKTIAGSTDVDLHRLTASWTEGVGNPFGNEGAGFPANTGDVTWTNRSRGASPPMPWGTPGGDFVSSASATVPVVWLGGYTWTSAQMATDVQMWLDNPSVNFGWILIGDESTPTTAKRFDSSENFVAADRPLLTIDFTSAPPGVRGDFNNDQLVDAADIDLMFEAVALGGDQTFDLTGDGSVNRADVEELVGGILGTAFGDANLDRRVSIGDLTIMAEVFGMTGGWSRGDFTGDGRVSIGDLTVMAENFGFDGTGAAALSVTTVPAPATSVVALGLLGGIAARRRRRVECKRQVWG